MGVSTENIMYKQYESLEYPFRGNTTRRMPYEAKKANTYHNDCHITCDPTFDAARLRVILDFLATTGKLLDRIVGFPVDPWAADCIANDSLPVAAGVDIRHLSIL
jgi:hypothetical protein